MVSLSFFNNYNLAVSNNVQVVQSGLQDSRLVKIAKGIGTGLLTGFTGLTSISSPLGTIFLASIFPPLILLDPLALIGGWEVTKRLAKRCHHHFRSLDSTRVANPLMDQTISNATIKPDSSLQNKKWVKWSWGAAGALAVIGAVALYALSFVALIIGALAAGGFPAPGPVNISAFLIGVGVMCAARMGTIALYELSKKCFQNARA